MADKHIYIDDSPKNPDLKTSPFDWTYTTNLTGRFGKVNCCMMKYVPPHTKLKIKPYFGFDMNPLVFPVQTNVRSHIKLYKVPIRILWKDFEDFASQLGTNGLPTNGGGTQFVRPYIKRPHGWNSVGSLAEQIGCCNLKYVQGVSGVPVGCSIYKGNVNESSEFPGLLQLVGPHTSFGDFYQWVQLPIGSILSPYAYDSYLGTSFAVSCVQPNSNSFTSGGGFKVEAFIKGSKTFTYQEQSSLPFGIPGIYPVTQHGYVRIASAIVSNLSNSAETYSSSSTNTFSPLVSTAVTLNGTNCFEKKFLIKIVDDGFYNTVNSYIKEDTTVFIRIVPQGLMYRNFYPDTFTQPFSCFRLQNSYTKVTKDPETSDLTFTVETNQTSSFGATMSVEVGVSNVEKSTTDIFDSIDGADPVQPVSALPFRALEFIHNYFMRNPRIDPFIKDGVPTYNRFLTNDGSGADETTPIDPWNALYESDYFTTCVKEPQFGNAPLVGVTVNDTSDTGILTFSDGQGYNDYTVKLNLDEDGNVAPLTVYKEDADHPNINRLREMIDFGISINDLRNVSTFQRMLERMQRTSYRFANVVYEFFGTNPPVGDHYPQYLGGVTRNISVDKITNIAESEGHPLGSFAGQGKVTGEGDTIEVFTTEPSYIVGIQYFTVTPCYSQYLPKHLLYTDPLDFYLNPEFAFMGPQPVFKKELAANQLADGHLNDVFGYNRPYAELFGNVDEVHGLYKTEMANFLLQRFFGSAPNLNKSFIEINPADLTNIFSVTENTDKLWGQILFKMSAQLPAPRSYLPRSI